MPGAGGAPPLLLHPQALPSLSLALLSGALVGAVERVATRALGNAQN